MPLGLGQGQNVGLTDFCHILTLLVPGASLFHKHKSCSCFDFDLKCIFTFKSNSGWFLKLWVPFLFYMLKLALTFELKGLSKKIFYAPGSNDRGHIVFVLSVCLSVCLFVCLLSTLTLAITVYAKVTRPSVFAGKI